MLGEYLPDTIFGNFVFLILVIIGFVICLRLGSELLIYLFSPSGNPMLIDGLMDAKHMRKIPQDPSASGSIPIIRSDDSSQGLVFTWSVWIFIEDLTYKQGTHRHIFHKGGDNTDSSGMSNPNNAPGLYISPDTNALVVVIDTFSKPNVKVNVPDIPLNKWVSVIIRVDQQHVMDVFVNGTLIRRKILEGIVKQNYGDVYVAMDGGFAGFISNLQYFNQAIGTAKIQSIVNSGPSLNLLTGGSALGSAKPRYLSLRWFFDGSNNMYNP